jgi:hypothetical protein
MKKDLIDGEEFYTYMAFIKHSSDSMGIQFIYGGSFNNEKKCNFNLNAFEKSKDKILSSIKFN